MPDHTEHRQQDRQEQRQTHDGGRGGETQRGQRESGVGGQDGHRHGHDGGGGQQARSDHHPGQGADHHRPGGKESHARSDHHPAHGSDHGHAAGGRGVNERPSLAVASAKDSPMPQKDGGADKNGPAVAPKDGHGLADTGKKVVGGAAQELKDGADKVAKAVGDKIDANVKAVGDAVAKVDKAIDQAKQKIDEIDKKAEKSNPHYGTVRDVAKGAATPNEWHPAHGVVDGVRGVLDGVKDLAKALTGTPAEKAEAEKHAKEKVDALYHSTYPVVPEAVAAYDKAIKEGKSPEEAKLAALEAGVKEMPFRDAEAHIEKGINAMHRGDNVTAAKEFGVAAKAFGDETGKIAFTIEGVRGAGEYAAGKLGGGGPKAVGETPRAVGETPKAPEIGKLNSQQVGERIGQVDGRLAQARERYAGLEDRAARTGENIKTMPGAAEVRREMNGLVQEKQQLVARQQELSGGAKPAAPADGAKPGGVDPHGKTQVDPHGKTQVETQGKTQVDALGKTHVDARPAQTGRTEPGVGHRVNEAGHPVSPKAHSQVPHSPKGGDAGHSPAQSPRTEPGIGHRVNEAGHPVSPKAHSQVPHAPAGPHNEPANTKRGVGDGIPNSREAAPTQRDHAHNDPANTKRGVGGEIPSTREPVPVRHGGDEVRAPTPSERAPTERAPGHGPGGPQRAPDTQRSPEHRDPAQTPPPHRDPGEIRAPTPSERAPTQRTPEHQDPEHRHPDRAPDTLPSRKEGHDRVGAHGRDRPTLR